jgi:DNA polymerase-3 subunit delta'
MTPEAANALLKVLEEPPPQTLLILTAAQRSDLLPTVVSRSHPVRFHPLPEDRIIKALQRRCGLSAETAALPAAMAHGSLSRAIAMAETTTGTGDWLQRRDALLSAAGLDHPDPFTFESLVLSLAFAERISGEKGRIPEMLDILQTVLRDLMALRCHSSNRFNKDLTQKLQYVSQHTRLEVLLAQLKAVQQTQREMAVNINPRLALESLMLRLRNACHEKNRRHPF